MSILQHTLGMKRGAFIVIDGMGGAGKTTQLGFLRERLGKSAHFAHEPGGTARAEAIRTLLLRDYDGIDNPLADFFLFWAARAEHMKEVIIPMLEKGMHVVSDRLDSSTFAFQIRAAERPEFMELFWRCREMVLAEYAPDLYIILDLPSDIAEKRRRKRHTGEDRFDEKDEAFQGRVIDGFKEFVQLPGINGIVVDANRPPEKVDEDLWRLVEPLVLRR